MSDSPTPRWIFIGGGQMARAMIGGMIASGSCPGEQIVVVTPSPSTRAWWSEHHPPVVQRELNDALRGGGDVVLAVKPPVIAKVLDQAAAQNGDVNSPNRSVWADRLILSVAAGVTLATIRRHAGHDRIVRVMPNTPSLVGRGASGYTMDAGTNDDDRQKVESLLNSFGIAVEVEERLLAAVTGLSGSGPAYVCMIIEALADGGVAAGLKRETAMKLAAATVGGTAEMVAQTGRHPGELKDAVASPGGTTIAAIRSLERSGIRAAMIDAVLASKQKAEC